MKYTIWVTFDFSKECGLDEVNKFMHSCGFTETAKAVSRVAVLELNLDAPATEEELHKYMVIIESTLREKLPNNIDKVEIC